MFRILNNPQDGLLLLSNPCIEVLADQVQIPNKWRKLTEYKGSIHENLSLGKVKLAGYIKENFNELMIQFIERNCIEFNEPNVSEHPNRLVDKILQTNRLQPEDNIKYLYIEYYSTVIYVMIADIQGLTRKIDNATELIEFFKTYIKLEK